MRILKCKCSRNLYQSQCESDINGAKVFLECKKIWAKYPPGRNFSQAETSVRAKCPQGEMSVRAKCPQGETSARVKCPQGETSARAKCPQTETSARAKCPQGEMSVRAKCPQAETSTRPKCPQAKTSVRAKCPGRNVHCQKVSDRNVIQPCCLIQKKNFSRGRG